MKDKLLALVFLISVITAHPSQALDIPLLTWEQGKSQSVVLGGPTASNNWKVVLYSENGYKASFSPSNINKSGYRVYSIDLPANLPEGAYNIKTEGPGSAISTVAQVLVVPLTIYEVPSAPIDLLVLLLILGFFVASITTKRNYRVRVPSHINHLSDMTKLAAGVELTSVKRLNFNSVEKKRTQFLDSIPEGTLKSVLLLDANLLLNIHRKLYWILPPLGIILASALSIIHLSDANFFTSADFPILFAISVVSILDLFSGFIAAVTYLALSFALQDGFGIRELVLNVGIAGIFLIPALFFMTTFLLSEPKDSSIKRLNSVIPFLGILYIPWSYFLLRSIGKVENFSLEKIGIFGIIVLVILFFKVRVTAEFLNVPIVDASISRVNERELHRIVALPVVLAFGSLLLAIYFNWTRDFNQSLIAALAWSLSLVLTNLRFESQFFVKFNALPRSELFELVLIGLGMCAIFAFMKIQPLLVQDRSSLMLSVLAIPLVLHGFYVLVAESGRPQESVAK